MRLLFVLMLLLAVPARAELLDPGTGKRLVVTAADRLVELDPTTGSTRELLTLPGLHEGAIEQLFPGVWVLVQDERLTGFAPDGKVLWTHSLDDPLVWGPEKADETRLALVSGDHLRLLDALTGQVVLDAALPGKPREVLPADENWLVVIPPKEAPAPDYGYSRPPASPPPPPAPEPERLVLIDGKTGQALWSLVPEGKIEDGPWPMGERVLEVEQGGAESPYFLVSLEPLPHILRGLQHPENYPIQELPSYQWDLPLKTRPVTAPEPMGPDLVVVEKDAVTVVGQERGTLRWERRFPAEIALDADDRPLVIVRQADLVVFVKDDKATRVVTLNRQTGDPENELEVAGAPLYVFSEEDELTVFFKTTTAEPRLDTGGHVVLDPKTRKAQDAFVDSFALVRLGDEARVLLEGPRQALVGAPVVRQGVLYFATRLTPPQKEGESRRVDVKYPEEPVLLHAFDLETGRELWTYRPTHPDDRLDESWHFLGERIWFSTPDNRLVLLDAATGRPVGVSPAFSEAPGSVEHVGDVLVVGSGEAAYQGLSAQAVPVWARRNFVPAFDASKLNNLIGVIILVVFLTYFIFAARRKQLFIRRIAGLNALDEAVGRATEMGKPVLYVHGLADVDDIQILASLSILGHVARKTAEYDTPILVPCSRSVVMSTAQEVVKEAYTAAGRPDAFQRDNINYLTDEQFGYVAGVDGIMLREKPAANFYLGTFYAESLILAETGHSTGAIQIAGTAMPSQLPFFVSACDYTLIGEELYAASAYLSRDPLQVGSLRGQDVGKALLMICIFVGAVLVTLHIDFVKEWFQ